MTRLPTLFLGHGSPMTMITENPARDNMVALGKVLPRPTAILCVTAHWQTEGKTHLTVGEHPRTIHDFGGFPQALYDMRYPAPGSAALVDRLGQLLGEERIARDAEWGFDHGVWGVLLPMFPQADIPVVAMSLDRSLGAEAHLELGAKLAPLRDEGVLIVGSGNIVHNLAFWGQLRGTQPDWALEFRDRINAAVAADDMQALTRFAPDDRAAVLAINSAEHYLPLLYPVGARLPGDEVAVFSDAVDGTLSMTSLLIGDAALTGTLTA